MELLHSIDFHLGTYKNINKKEGKRDIIRTKSEQQSLNQIELWVSLSNKSQTIELNY